MSKFKPAPSVKLLKTLYNYDPSSGHFTYKAPVRNAVVGARAGWVNDQGYLIIHIDQVRYRAHRVAWLYVHGEWPHDEMDHINGNRLDNRICNLRVVSGSENMGNSKPHADSRTGFKGVHYDKNKRKWGAQICHKGKRIFLGRHSTPELAHKAYKAKATELFGEFARTK